MTSSTAYMTGYETTARQIGTPRNIEYRVFARVTGMLTHASGPDGDFPDLVAALHENQSLWTVIMLDVAGEANGLPDDLRARLFYLGEFTRKHTQEVLRREADAEPLIEINTMIMRGLRQHAPGKGLETCRA